MAFDPSDHAAPYISQDLAGGLTSALSYHWSSDSTLGISHHNGKSKALQAIQNGLHDTELSDKADAWAAVEKHTGEVHTALSEAYRKAFNEGNWSGDDADRAAKTFGYTVDSAGSVHSAASGMAKGTRTLAAMAKKVKGLDSSSPGLLESVANVAADTTVPGVVAQAAGADVTFDGGGDNLDSAVQYMTDQISAARSPMPSTIAWQTKTAAGSDPQLGNNAVGGGSGVGGTGGVGGARTPGHTTADVTGLKKPTDLDTTTNYDPGVDDDPTDGIGDPTTYSPPGDGSGVGGTSYDPTAGGYGGPSLDSGSTLAGYDGGGLGSGGGAGSVGAGGVGAGAGSGSLGGSGLLGAGGVGAGAAGAGANGATGTGSGGRGASGVMAPMRGGGPGGNGDDERERSTWLSEDDDVWGDDDAPPSVIS